MKGADPISRNILKYISSSFRLSIKFWNFLLVSMVRLLEYFFSISFRVKLDLNLTRNIRTFLFTENLHLIFWPLLPSFWFFLQSKRFVTNFSPVTPSLTCVWSTAVFQPCSGVSPSPERPDAPERRTSETSGNCCSHSFPFKQEDNLSWLRG